MGMIVEIHLPNKNISAKGGTGGGGDLCLFAQYYDPYKSVKFLSPASVVGKCPKNWLEDSILQ